MQLNPTLHICVYCVFTPIKHGIWLEAVTTELDTVPNSDDDNDNYDTIHDTIPEQHNSSYNSRDMMTRNFSDLNSSCPLGH